jgi:DNA polymerase III sliding clamp (beta) subunit (PCNA family)
MKAMPEVEDLQEISTDFTRLFKHVEKAVSTDSTRTHLTNIYFEKQEDALCAVATDGHRLHLAISQDSSAATKVLDGFLVSCYRLLQDWFKFYGVSTVLVGKQKLTGTLLLKIGSSWLTMSSSSQSFPDYKAVVPSEKSIKSRWVSQNKKAWIQKLEQVKAQGFDSVILSQDGDFAVLKGNNLVKKATLDAASQKKVAIDFEEKPLPYQVSLNISYLCDAVNSISTDVFTLHFGGDNMSPLVLESQDESTISFLITQDNSRLSCKSVIMPQRI